MVEIQLTPAEIFQGANAGIMRQVHNLQRRRQPRYGADCDRDWQRHIEGCLGEMAVAKYLGLFWTGNHGILNPGDVGTVEVRTRSKHCYDLIVHPSDRPEVPYVLVTGLNGSYRLQGWCWGAEAQREQFWADPAGGRAAYFVPAHALRAMETLLPQLARRQRQAA